MSALPSGWVLVCAASREAAGVEDLGTTVLGVGKAAFAAGLTELLLRQPPAGVLLFGVCGAFPARHRLGAALRVGDLCLIDSDRFGDEGVLTPQGFFDLGESGLLQTGPFTAAPGPTAAVAAALGIAAVPGVTVSSCSGTEVASKAMAARTSAMVETMEGAALGLVASRHRVPWVQLRAVSNFTGDRDRAAWDFDAAAARLHAALRRLRP